MLSNVSNLSFYHIPSPQVDENEHFHLTMYSLNLTFLSIKVHLKMHFYILCIQFYFRIFSKCIPLSPSLI
jgi:hypothetical protein